MSNGKMVVGFLAVAFATYMTFFNPDANKAKEPKPARIAPGVTVVLKDPVVACETEPPLERLIELIRDEEARQKHLIRVLSSGGCKILNEPTRLLIERQKGLSDLTQVREPGSPDSRYVVTGQLEAHATIKTD